MRIFEIWQEFELEVGDCHKYAYCTNMFYSLRKWNWQHYKNSKIKDWNMIDLTLLYLLKCG